MRYRMQHVLKSDINVTPFVDVMLVLLIIFMITSPMLISGVDVELPEAKTAAIDSEIKPITVSITKNKEIFIEETAVKITDLSSKLDAILKAKKDTRIFIRGDKDVDYGMILQVFAEIKNAGFTNVGLLTNVEQG